MVVPERTSPATEAAPLLATPHPTLDIVPPVGSAGEASDVRSAAPGGAATGASDAAAEDIELRLPATPTHLPVVRALAADLAARLDFDLDEISDLRMAVDEACAGLVARVASPHRLTCVFRTEDDALEVRVSAVTTDGAAPARNTFGWRVLSALVDEVDAWADEDRTVHLRIHKRRLGMA